MAGGFFLRVLLEQPYIFVFGFSRIYEANVEGLPCLFEVLLDFVGP